MSDDIRNLSKWLNEEQETPIDRQALARVLAMADQPAQGCDYCNHHQYAGTKCKNCGREQPAQQEPVAWYHAEDYKTHFTSIPSKDLIESGYWKPLYTSLQAQRTWVGLTDVEIVDLCDGRLTTWGQVSTARAIEAKLKEKNT